MNNFFERGRGTLITWYLDAENSLRWWGERRLLKPKATTTFRSGTSQKTFWRPKNSVENPRGPKKYLSVTETHLQHWVRKKGDLKFAYLIVPTGRLPSRARQELCELRVVPLVDLRGLGNTIGSLEGAPIGSRRWWKRICICLTEELVLSAG